ncbi:MAG: hypothetical protein HBSAPP03_29550 [Phycisphaerae bacterium]|nr:MAG: hypothetical protein HBSAPP03_29550 [Phycisphaerae bacterium]
MAVATLRTLATQAIIVACVVGSAIATKEFGQRPMPLAAVRMPAPSPIWLVSAEAAPAAVPDVAESSIDVADDASDFPPDVAIYARDPAVRWFNGRPVRPARELWMEVTAYSPDWRSCGVFADGLTATLHSVETNGHALVAADPTMLPYGTMLTVPGYDQDRIVPVLDCGSAIKGRRLDVLFPTHEEARKWGRQRLLVIVWEYADGLPAENPRAVR